MRRSLVVPAAVVRRNLEARMELEESGRAEVLPPHGEGLVDPEPISEPLALLASWQHDRGSTSEDAAAGEAGVEGAPYRKLDVADATAPCAARLCLLRAEGQLHLVLAAGADPMLVDELVRDGFGAGTGDRRRPDGLVLGERFLGEEGAREVQLAARPGGIVTEGPDVFDDAIELVG